ncbi:MAG: hypothetical protein ACE5JM_17730 [Armatimonadota bacterium]
MFASEVKAILELPSVSRTPNADRMLEFVAAPVSRTTTHGPSAGLYG